MYDITVYDNHNEPIRNLVQWDSNVIINIKEASITKSYDVHFFNDNCEEALLMKSTYLDGTLKVEIPNILLQESKTITGYVYIDEAPTSFRSMYAFRLLVRNRPKPSNYVYVESENFITFEKILAEIKLYAKNAQTSEANAKQSETNAKTSEAEVKKMQDAINKEKGIIDKAMSDFNTSAQKTQTDAINAINVEGANQTKLVTDEGAKQLLILQQAAQGVEADRQQIQTNKTDIGNKLDKNLGVPNSGKVLSVDSTGNVIASKPLGIKYNPATNCLEFGYLDVLI